MPCFKPLKAWRTTENTRNRKKAISFKQSDNTTTPLNLPCGQCIGCRLDRSRKWAIRCVQESQMHTQNSFITLTYAPEHLPQDGSLVKWHFTDFMKRLRSRISPKTISYFMCGEYGENFERPHYHACLFGHDFEDKSPIQECEGIILYASPLLDDLWSHGHCSVGDVTFESAAYVARYIVKKQTGENSYQHYQTTCEHTGNLINREPEYANMSLNPAIGKRWYDKYQNDLYPSGFLVHNHAKQGIPRYYDKLYEFEGGDIEHIKLLRKKKAASQLKNNTPDRLAVREKVQLLKFKQLPRTYENES